MKDEIYALTNGGKNVFLAASRPSIGTNKFRFVTVPLGLYGETITQIKRRYGNNPFHLRRYIEPSLLEKAVSIYKGISYHEIELESPESEVLDVIRSFSPVYYENKGFALIDICEFSKKPTAEQISQKMILERAFLHAKKDLYKTRTTIVEDCHLGFSFHSTGDGFYIWNKYIGRHADSILLAYLLFAVTFLKRSSIDTRSAFGIGEAYIFPRLEKSFPSDAIGDVLNDVARLVSFASRNQILIQEFETENEAPNSITNSCALVNCIPELIEEKHRLNVNLGDMAELLWAEDKHGKRHYFRNLNGDFFIYGSDSEPYQRERLGVEEEKAIQFSSKKYS